MAAELEAVLVVLGLEQYLPRFLNSGFGDWDALTRIAETQLSLLDVRLGHRRRLQRAIARERLWPDDIALPLAPDLNQRIRDWLRPETCLSFATEDSVSLAWPCQISDVADIEPYTVTSEDQPRSSSDDSSSHTIDSGAKVLKGLKVRRAPCLDLEDHRVGSKSLGTLSKSGPETVERGVT
ncbi:hypothetical protein DL98DRAFT_649230 [Cadophora sp. DSE1049]|nr:hypothetical protein DL98DRAFT_649230 [Cadophora sp. DSE1049]